jgi:hypothetical protein
MFPTLLHQIRRRVPITSPLDISGLELWLDFSDISTLYTDSAKTTPVTSDGDVIGAVEDKSGNGNDVLQITAPQKPIYKTGIQNGLSVGRFAFNTWMQAANNTVLDFTTESISIILVGKSTDDGDRYFLSKLGANKGYRVMVTDVPAFRYQAGDGSLVAIIEATTVTSMMEAGVIHAHGGNATLYKNGSQLGSTVDFSGVGSKANTDIFTVGENSSILASANNQLVGDIGEIILYSKALTVRNYKRLQYYINAKWAVY